jgi:Asp-tRNA(Asn)/Glu-tRNA(Gln) amidotransferase A subunit family amidase
MTPHGPVGVQLVAARFREDVCLEAGAAIEERLYQPAIASPPTSPVA